MGSQVSINVEFGGMSVGEDTARIGFQLKRDGQDLAAFDSYFGGRRLKGKVSTSPAVDQKQKTLPGMKSEHLEIVATFDSGRFGVSSKKFSGGLTFSRSEIDVSQLANLAKKSGSITAEVLGDIEDFDDQEDNDGPTLLDQGEDEEQDLESDFAAGTKLSQAPAEEPEPAPAPKKRGRPAKDPKAPKSAKKSEIPF